MRGMKLFHTIVLTAGISVIMNNLSNINEKFPEFKDTDDKITEDKQVLMDDMVKFLTDEVLAGPIARNFGAEVSTMGALKKQDRLHNNPKITIFHTDTLRGNIAALTVRNVIEKHYSAYVSLKKIRDVNVNDRPALSSSLGEYLSEVSSELLKGEPSSTCFAPIGGFKVMTSLGYLVGAFHNFPTVYLHEGSSVLHFIPPVKIQIDEDFIVENHRFIRKLLIEEVVKYDSLSLDEKNLIEREPTFFTVYDGFADLNPFGQFICRQEKFKHYFTTPVSIDESILQWIKRKYPSELSFAYSEINKLIKLHSNDPIKNKGVLYHEVTFKTGDKGKYCHLFKGQSKPKVFRALWHYNEKEGRYYNGKIWFDHDVYEREATSYLEDFNIEKTKWIDISKETGSVFH